MYAIDNLSDAIDVTRDRLTPFDLWMWVRLAIVVFFIGGVGLGVPTFGGDLSGFDEPGEDIETNGEAEELDFEEATGISENQLLGAFLIVFALVVFFGLLYIVLSAIMEFALVESLRSEEVHVRRYAKENLGRGLRLLGFRIGLWIVFGVVGVATFFLGALVVLGSIDEVGAASLGALLVVFVLVIGLYLLFATIMKLTTEFVVPIMLLEERGVLSAWSRFWPTLTGSWKEYLVYIVLVVIIQIALGIAVTILAFIAGLVIAIPVLVVAVLLGLFGGTPGIVLAVGIALLGFLFWLLVYSFIEVPVVAYVRYYALLLLGDTNDTLDLIPDRRARARAAGDDAGGAGGAGGPEREPSAWDREDDGRDDGWDSSSSWDDRDDSSSSWDDRDDDRSGWDDRDDRR
ncbi:DUF7544 domain-containing protein [Natronobiforma cellulositropha]|uniref:DUF7544 domain-containing protein n=1 Tax=Natronobiforma cellulositropha TaxID=1679076 RepID=UPI0021D61074|nr:hypothetical protein [Natronobiforma cellulositropha]